MKRIHFLCLFLIFHFSIGYGQGASALSLEEAKSLALKQNPQLQMYYNEVEAQKGIYWSEIIPQNPEFGIEAEQIPWGGSYRNFGEKKTYISQLLDFPTNYFFLHKQLNAEIQRQQYILQEFKRELIFQVKEAYYTVLLQRELVALGQKNLQLSQNFYQRAKRSYELGESDRLTMLKARVNLGEAKRQLNADQKDLDAGMSRLRQVLGLKEEKQLTIALTDSIPETIKEISYEEIKPGLKLHPALKAAQTRQQAALNESRLAYGGFLPKLSLTYYKQEINNEYFWGGSVGLSFPLWFFGQKGRIEEKKAQLSTAEYFIKAEELRLEKNFYQAMANFQKAANEALLYQTSLLGEAEEIFRIARRSYAFGEIGYLRYIDAQQTLINTRSGYLRSLTNYQIEKAHLSKLVGDEL